MCNNNPFIAVCNNKMECESTQRGETSQKTTKIKHHKTNPLLEGENNIMTSNEVIITVPLQRGGQPPASFACNIINKDDMPFIPSTCNDAAGGLLSTYSDNTNDVTGGLLTIHPGNTVTPLVASIVAKDMPPVTPRVARLHSRAPTTLVNVQDVNAIVNPFSLYVWRV